MNVGIVAHLKRVAAAEALAAQVDADCISYDDGTLGCEGNHRKVWQWHQDNTTTEWSIVLEDDAQPVEGFTDQLTQALAVAPTPIVSLYLGTGRPPQWQGRVGQAIRQADIDNASFITARRLIHGVAICLRTDLIGSMLTHLNTSTRPIDWAIRDWATREDHLIAFTTPSLVDHADGPTLIDRDDSARTETRTAWRVGTRDRWTAKAVPL